MLFCEPLFLFLFFPVVFTAYLAVRRRGTARVLVLLAASLFFYLWSEPLFVPVVIATCVTDYGLARFVAAGRRWALPVGVLINLAMLAYFKSLGGNRVPQWRRYVNLWVCFLASGLWHGAAWTYVIWGAYNGVFLVLERLFLLRYLDRMPRLAANAWTFAVTVTGWLVFRAASLGQVGAFLDAMEDPGRQGAVLGLYRTPLMWSAMAVATLISFLPRVPGFDRAQDNALAAPAGRAALDAALAVLFVFALAKALADPFKPFLYFRF